MKAFETLQVERLSQKTAWTRNLSRFYPSAESHPDYPASFMTSHSSAPLLTMPWLVISSWTRITSMSLSLGFIIAFSVANQTRWAAATIACASPSFCTSSLLHQVTVLTQHQWTWFASSKLPSKAACTLHRLWRDGSYLLVAWLLQMGPPNSSGSYSIRLQPWLRATWPAQTAGWRSKKSWAASCGLSQSMKLLDIICGCRLREPTRD